VEDLALDVIGRLRHDQKMSTTIAAGSRNLTRPGLDELVTAIATPARSGADPDTTARLVADVLAARRPGPELLTARERAGSPDTATSHTLHAEEAFTLSAIVWRPGQTTSIHDHLVWCSFVVLCGTETETLYGLRDGGLVETGVRHRAAGSVSAAAPPDDIHRVSNTGDDIAITLHVYGADVSTGSSVRRKYPDSLVTPPVTSTRKDR
jgi:predicted metal-dependent enzyme (double-stranded beta helix superfamily)